MIEVLIRAGLTAEGLVLVAPGVEVPAHSVDLLIDVPPDPFGRGVVALMYFEDEGSREKFHDIFADDDAVMVADL